MLDEAEKFFASFRKGYNLKKPLTIKEKRALRKAAIAASNKANKTEAVSSKPKNNVYTKERKSVVVLDDVYDNLINLTEQQKTIYTEYKKFASPMRRYDVDKLLVKSNKTLSSRERESLVNEYEYYAWHYGS